MRTFYRWRNYYSGNEYKKQYVRLVLVQTGKRGANAQYQIVDAMQMVVIGLIAGATSMVQIVKVWADEVLMKIAGWKEIPVDTTKGRIMKLVTQGDIVELTEIIHRFRGQVWKRAVRSGHKLRSALSDMWIDVDSAVDGVYGNQQGAEVGYNPHKTCPHENGEKRIARMERGRPVRRG